MSTSCFKTPSLTHKTTTTTLLRAALQRPSFTHIRSSSQFRPTLLPFHRFYSSAHKPAAMSLVHEHHEWGAARVRQTFLDYFKEHGHTFGMSTMAILSSPIALEPNCYILTTTCSPVIFSRAPLRPHPPLHQCGHEPVQVHFPRHRRSLLR